MHDASEWSEEKNLEWLRRWAVSTSDQAMIALSPAGHVLSWNPGGQAMHGYPGDEIVGRHISVPYADDDCQRGVPEHVLREAREHGRHEFEGWRRRKGGDLFWANVVTTAISRPDGRLDGFVEVVRDVSDKRQAHEAVIESERRFWLLVDGVTDYSIFMLSPEGHVTNGNQGARP
ncbi:PAS domain-containing protein [Paraburkholderia tropica]|uniref:PAS domain-containing protein n=1 Tax=Paraburkholderia tropica TaxID=92647 RepID=UPI002AAF2515|nr:PAS domain S-box protein [Paraburkholderia tropica]